MCSKALAGERLGARADEVRSADYGPVARGRDCAAEGARGRLAQLKKVEAKEKNADVREDLEIVQKTFDLQFRQDDYQLDHKVPFIDASAAVFSGLRSLLDDQVAAERRPAAVARLKKYAGVEPGFKPFTDLLKQRVVEQMAKPGVVYPSIGEMETELGRDKNYIDGLRQLFVKYKLTGWEEPFVEAERRTGGLRHVGSRNGDAQGAQRFQAGAGGVCAESGELRRRYSAGAIGGDGAPGLHRRPGADGRRWRQRWRRRMGGS